jgi:hypothetical protein
VCEGHTDSEGDARDLVATVRRLHGLPLLREEFERGTTSWTELRTISRVATPEDEAFWLGDARVVTNRKLEAKVRAALGLPAVERRVYELTPEQAAIVDNLVAQQVKAARDVGQELSQGEAIFRLCLAAQEGGAAAGPAKQLVVHTCDRCKQATVETREGSTPLSPETAELLSCDADVVDARGEVKRLSKTVPPATRRHVRACDKDRCQVPRCKNRGYLHLHHAPGRAAVGHDPDRVTMLCTSHHPAVHVGHVDLRGSRSKGWRYFRADGAELTEAGVVPPVAVDPRTCAASADLEPEPSETG